jgi:MGT family glycosyltransferase
MARIAYVGLPAHGHTNPTLPIMKALVARGHQVRYYNAAAFRAKLAPTGVDFIPLPEPLPTERELAEALHDFVNASLIISRVSRHLTRFLIDAFAEEPPDLVIYDSAAMWGYIAARTHAIPQLCFITTFVLDGSLKAIGLGTMARFFLSALPQVPRLLRWRRGMAREFGAENAGGITEYAGLNLVFTSREFHPPNSFIDDRFRFVGPILDPALRDGTFPFEQLRDGPRVYLSLGTINHLNLDFYRRAFAAFADHPAQFILAAGRNTDLNRLGPAPDNFFVRDYVPQLEILQQVDAFVTHGGMNSVHEGLYYGVPQVVVPTHFEQLLNGKRVLQTGSGILLRDQQPAAARLREAVDRLLNIPAYRENAGRVGATLRDAGGVHRAVAEIETYLAAQT